MHSYHGFFYRPVYFYKPSDWRQSMKSDNRPENSTFDFLMTFSLRFQILHFEYADSKREWAHR